MSQESLREREKESQLSGMDEVGGRTGIIVEMSEAKEDQLNQSLQRLAEHNIVFLDIIQSSCNSHQQLHQPTEIRL